MTWATSKMKKEQWNISPISTDKLTTWKVTMNSGYQETLNLDKSLIFQMVLDQKNSNTGNTNH